MHKVMLHLKNQRIRFIHGHILLGGIFNDLTLVLLFLVLIKLLVSFPSGKVTCPTFSFNCILFILVYLYTYEFFLLYLVVFSFMFVFL